MARCALLLAAIAAILAAAVPSAQAGQFASESFGLAGTAGTGNLPGHGFSFFRDGLASQCNDGFPLGGSPTGTATPLRAYKSRAFTSVLNESVCVSITVAAPTCSGTNGELMSETYSPAFDPSSIAANWIGDLGDYPPGAYSVVVPAGARFETVVDELNPAASCGGVNVTWSSDRPWAGGRPFPSGLPAVGQTLSSTFDVWSGSPAVGRQWTRCDAAGANCTDIPGATGTSYVLTDADTGHRIGVNESATEGGLTSTVTGRTTPTPVFIPALTRDGQSLATGDSAVSGHLNLAPPPSSCDVPKTAPATSGSEIHFYDTLGLTSLINEPTCVWVAQIPRSGGGFCIATLTVYAPSFDPADLRRNYVGDDSGSGTLSYTLAPGESGAGGGPGGEGTGGADRTGPKAKLALARTTLQKVVTSGSIPVYVTCDEPCAITLRADVTRKLRKRLGGVKIASGKGNALAGKRKTVKVKLTRKARRGLRRMRSITFTLKATAKDGAGNTGTATRKLRIKRKR